MPELPQVQGFVNYFKYTCLHKKISRISCKDELVENTSCSYIQRVLKNRQFKTVYRKGKYLIASLENDSHMLVLHFGMTGNLLYGLKDNLSKDDKQYAKLIIEFQDNYQLAFINTRKLGKIFLATDISDIEPLKEMGAEPSELSKNDFLDSLNQRSNKNIKSFLMDQTIIAGIGNEFSNELLFQAEIDPHKKIDAIDEGKRIKLYDLMKDILDTAVDIFKKNKDSADYPDSWLLAHQKDKVCPKNKNHQFKKETIAGRSALYCPEHQG